MIFMLAACGAGKATPTPLPTVTATLPPTATSTPVVPLAVLVLPADMDKDTYNLYQKTVYDLAQQAGMRFQVRNKLAVADLEPGLKIVIILPPDPGIVELAAAAPDAQFLAVGLSGVNPGGNISVLAQNSQIDVVSFIAGYIAALVTDDYRTGIIIPRDDPNGMVAYNAFNNGHNFFCGTCPMQYGPFQDYPLYVQIPPDAKVSEYPGYANYLTDRQRMVYTIFVYPGLDVPQLLESLMNSGTLVIGTKSPEKAMNNWVCTLQADTIAAIRNAWPNLLAGQGGQTIYSPLAITDVNSDLLTPGRLRLANATLNGVLSGEIAIENLNP
jgi:hypothetical protein